LVISVNTMNGPGLLAIPTTYVQAGWLIPTCLLLLVACIAAASGCFLVDAIVRTTKELAAAKGAEFTESDSLTKSTVSSTAGQPPEPVSAADDDAVRSEEAWSKLSPLRRLNDPSSIE